MQHRTSLEGHPRNWWYCYLQEMKLGGWRGWRENFQWIFLYAFWILNHVNVGTSYLMWEYLNSQADSCHIDLVGGNKLNMAELSVWEITLKSQACHRLSSHKDAFYRGNSIRSSESNPHIIMVTFSTVHVGMLELNCWLETISGDLELIIYQK